MTLAPARRPDCRAAPGRRRSWVVAAVAVVIMATLLGCTPDVPVGRAPSTGPVPGSGATDRRSGTASTGLPGAKASAKITDCPTVASAQPVTGGLPDIALGCLGGGPSVPLTGLRRTPTVINIWAQWCGPCRQEAPYLAEVSRAAGDKVSMLGVDYDDPRPDLAIDFAAKAGWHYPQLTDGDKTLQVPLKILGPPQTVFVSADGRVVFINRVPFRSAVELRTQIREHLGVTL